MNNYKVLVNQQNEKIDILNDKIKAATAAKDFNKVYSVIKRRSKRRGISMLQGDWGGNPKIIPNPAGSIEFFNHLMGSDSSDSSEVSADSSSSESGSTE